MTAWTRSRRPSLRSRLETWLLTVASMTNSRWASSALDSPLASRRRTSVSRAVSSESAGGVVVCLAGSAWANWASSRRVTEGASRAGGQRAGRSWYGFPPGGWPVSGGEEDQQGTGVGVGPGSGEDAAEVLAGDPDDGRDDNGKGQGGPGAGDRQEDARRDEAEDDGEDDRHCGALARDQVRCIPVE